MAVGSDEGESVRREGGEVPGESVGYEEGEVLTESVECEDGEVLGDAESIWRRRSGLSVRLALPVTSTILALVTERH